MGILEEKSKTLAVFKHFLPKIFRGVTLGDFGHKNIKNKHTSSGRKDNHETRKILEDRMKGEYRVYRHAVNRLNNQYQIIKNK